MDMNGITVIPPEAESKGPNILPLKRGALASRLGQGSWARAAGPTGWAELGRVGLQWAVDRQS